MKLQISICAVIVILSISPALANEDLEYHGEGCQRATYKAAYKLYNMQNKGSTKSEANTKILP